MQLHKPILTRKQLTISAIAFVAAMGLVLSVFAETAGGANLQDANKDNHNASASYQAAQGVFSHVDIDNAGSTITTAVASATNGNSNAAANPANSDPAGQPTGAPSGQPSTGSSSSAPPAGATSGTSDSGTTPIYPLPSPPPYHCGCPRIDPATSNSNAMIACPDYCLPQCPPCGAYPKVETSEARMCPEMMCPLAE